LKQVENFVRNDRKAFQSFHCTFPLLFEWDEAESTVNVPVNGSIVPVLDDMRECSTDEMKVGRGKAQSLQTKAWASLTWPTTNPTWGHF
jgi:hypothetical protein